MSRPKKLLIKIAVAAAATVVVAAAVVAGAGTTGALAVAAGGPEVVSAAACSARLPQPAPITRSDTRQLRIRDCRGMPVSFTV